jgi:hypothetical protein
MKQDYDKLLYILSNLEKKDPQLLELLHYADYEPNTGRTEIPLVKALKFKNHRIVNLLLKKMSDINYAAIRQLADYMDQLIPYKGFAYYLEETPFHTHMMLNK